MRCGTCMALSDSPRIRAGMRVTVSRWEQVWLAKDLVGTVEQIGHPETQRRATAKVRWDNGHKDQWWPVRALIPLDEGAEKGRA